MQKTIVSLTAVLFVAVALVIGSFFLMGRDQRAAGAVDATFIITTTLDALLAADIGNSPPPFEKLGGSPGWNQAAQFYENSATGLTEGASTFFTLTRSSNLAVSSAAAAGHRMFKEMAAFDRDAALKLKGIAAGLTPRDRELGWFFEGERRRLELWNTVSHDVTRPLADACLVDMNASAPRLKLTASGQRDIRTRFAQAAAETGGNPSLPSNLVNDFYARLFGQNLYGRERP